MLARLDIKGPNLIKGIHLEGLRVIGSPNEYAINKDTKNKLTTKINLNNAEDDFLFKLSHKNITETYDDNLLNKCKELEAGYYKFL